MKNRSFARGLALVMLVSLFVSLFAGMALAETYVKTTADVNVRKGPGLDYATIDSVTKGNKYLYKAQEKDERGVTWYKVDFKGRNGWISSKYADTYTTPDSGTETGKIYGVGKSNIRSKASLTGKVLGTFPKGAEATHLDSATDARGVRWYKIKYDGITGWVSSAYTSTVKGGKGSSNYESVSGSNRVYATNGSSYIRKSPDKDSAILSTLPEGENAKYYGARKDDRGVSWYKVKYNGVTGWVSSKYTELK